jgi:hypothetical protein
MTQKSGDGMDGDSDSIPLKAKEANASSQYSSPELRMFWLSLPPAKREAAFFFSHPQIINNIAIRALGQIHLSRASLS